jgi:hypothetical protein
LQFGCPQKEIDVRLAQAALLDGDQSGPLLPEPFQRRIAAGILTRKTKQPDVTEFCTGADASVFQKPVRRENALEDLIRIKG